MEIITLIVGQLRTNCFLLFDRRSKETLVVDPADDADYIIRTISDHRLKPKKIVATHGHFDHILAVEEIRLAYRIPFLISKSDEFLTRRTKSTLNFFTGLVNGLEPEVGEYVKEGDKIKFGKSFTKVLRTPGHTPGSISLYSEEKNSVFVGDTIFAKGGIGRTDFSYGSKVDLRESIEKIMKLPGNTVVHSGHGEKTTVKEAKKYFYEL